MLERTPMQFIGLARTFRHRFARADGDPATNGIIQRITTPARERCNRHPVPRPEHLIQLERDWKAMMPQHGRLSLKSARKGRKLLISEVRVGASTFDDIGWTETERGISVMHVRARIEPRIFEVVVHPLAAVSIHALARRYQRDFDLSDEAIFRDLEKLADAFPETARQPVGTQFRVATDGGAWVGHVTRIAAGKRVVLNVRTYIPEHFR